MASPIFFIKKKDGALCLVQDYRMLNAMTVKNKYPLPLIPELIAKIGGAKYFTKLDVRWDFNNVRMKEGDKWKAAFRTNHGLFELLVMFFGLTNSPAMFQTMMNHLFREQIARGCVVVYMDDSLIFSSTMEEHRRVVREVLEIIRDNRLYLKAEKCEFEQSEIDYLGLKVAFDKIAMDTVKVQGVADWPTPENTTDVRSFLGFTNFYRRFIHNFSDIAKPMNALLQKDAKWFWADEQARAFEQLKRAICSAPVLVFPDPDRAYLVEADSSGYATGAVLSQMREDDKWHPVAFISKSLSPAERNYNICDKEMLAIIRALEQWRHYLEGAKHPVQVLTDHKNLEYFMAAQKLNRRQARWSTYLSRFDLDLSYRPGKSSAKPDLLSRRADHKKGGKEDNENVVLLKPVFFQNRIATTFVNPPLLKMILTEQARDADVKTWRSLNTEDAKTAMFAGWHEDAQGLVTLEGKVYVPMACRAEVLRQYHDSPITGHPGQWRTLELVRRTFRWKGMTTYVGKYVRSCDLCQRTKIFPAKPQGELTPNEIPTRPWQTISTDLITQLPDSQGYDSILVVVDRFSKMMHTMPTTATVTAEGVARLFRDHVWKLHGLPEKVLSDQGPQFASRVMRELNRMLGIKTATSTAFHPQTDGQTERVNQEIEQYLRLFIEHRQSDWMNWLPMAEFSYNNRMQAATKNTPFMLNFGQHPRMGMEPRATTKVNSVENFVSQLMRAREDAAAALTKAAEDMKRYYDARRGKTPQFAIGDKVWLDAKHIETGRPMKKLDHKRLGPYEVTQVLDGNAY